MKKPYQIESQRAVKQLEAMAADRDPAVQMVLPMAEMLGWLRQGVGELILSKHRGGAVTQYPGEIAFHYNESLTNITDPVETISESALQPNTDFIIQSTNSFNEHEE